MLKITINNQEVDLGELKGITLQYNGGVFEFEKIEGSYSIPFNIPMSDKNKKIFDFPYRQESVNNEIREYDYELWHSGIKIETGTLNADMYNKKTIRCKLFINNGSFYNKLKLKKLKEHDIGGDKPFVFKGYYPFDSNDYDFLLYEVRNETFLKDTLWENYGSDWYEVDELGNSSQYVSGYEGITGWDREINPYLYFLVKDAGSYNALIAYESETDRDNDTNPVFTIADDSTVIFQTYESGYGGTLDMPAGIIAGDKFKVRFAEQKIYQNFYEHNPQDGPEHGEFFLGQYVPSIITPFPLLYKVLKYLIVGLGFNYIDNFFTDGYKRLNIFNVNNAVQHENYWNEHGGPFLRNKLDTYNLANHLPDIKTEEFIIAIQNFFNILFYFNNDNVIIKERQSLIEDINYDDYTTKQIKYIQKNLFEVTTGYILSTEKNQNDDNISWVINYGERKDVINRLFTSTDPYIVGQVRHEDKVWTICVLIKSIVSGNVFIHPAWIQWLPSTIPQRVNRNFHYFQSFSHRDKGFKINLGVTTVSDFDERLGLYYTDNLFIHYSDTEPIYYNIPVVKMKGNSYVNNTEEDEEFKLTLMSYLNPGETKPNGEITYDPFGTQQAEGITISSEWSYHNRWESFIKWYQKISKAEYIMKIPLSLSEIKNFDFTKKKLINRELFFVKSFKVQLLRNSIMPVEAVLIKA